MMVNRKRQEGMTAIGWVIVLGLVAFFVLLALKMIPAYIEYFKVKSAIVSLDAEANVTQKPISEIRTLLERRFYMDEVRNIKKDDISIKKDRGEMKIAVDYERRENIFGNVDVVMTFKKETVLSD